MDVLEPIEPEEGPARLGPPPLGQPLGDPYGAPAGPAPRRRRLIQAVVATALVAGLVGTAIGIGVAGTNGRATLAIRPAASTSGQSGSSGSSGATDWPRKGAGLRFGRIVGGTVTKVSGDTITVATPFTNQTATVTTTAQTVYRKIVLGQVSDIKNQDKVAVVGTTAANGHLTASFIAIIPTDLVKPAPPAGAPATPPPGAPATPPPGVKPMVPRLTLPNIAIGTVSSFNGTSFVVTRRDGTKVTVDTNSATKVLKEVAATKAEVVPNTRIIAVGTPGATVGTLTASRIEILPASLPGAAGVAGAAGPGFGFGFPFGLPFGPGLRAGHGFGHRWGPAPAGQPGTGPATGGRSSGSAPATPQSVSV
jgi:hypothetical protein